MKKVLLSFALCIFTTASYAQSGVMYYWHFNSLNTSTSDVTEIEADIVVPPTSQVIKLEYTNPNPPDRDIDEFSDGSLLNVQFGEPAGKGARVRNPSTNRSLVFDVPTLLPDAGIIISNVSISYAVQRSNQGMLKNIIEYSLDGTTFISTGLDTNEFDINTDYELISVNFSNVAGVNANPNFKIRISFDGNTVASNGNNRYDNIVLMGTAGVNSVDKFTLESKALKVSPNPSKGLFNLSLENAEIKNVKIFDLRGALILETESTQIDLSQKAHGTYIALVEDRNGKIYQSKMVLQK